MLTASNMLMEAVITYKTSTSFYEITGVTSQKTAILILVAVLT
jgi:uncharacterized protein YpmB